MNSINKVVRVLNNCVDNCVQFCVKKDIHIAIAYYYFPITTTILKTIL